MVNIWPLDDRRFHSGDDGGDDDDDDDDLWRIF